MRGRLGQLAPKPSEQGEIEMNREEIIEMAREAGLAVKPPYWGYTEQYHFAGFEQTFERFVACVEERAAAAEREACAKVCEDNADCCNRGSPLYTILSSNAAAIRARGNT